MPTTRRSGPAAPAEETIVLGVMDLAVLGREKQALVATGHSNRPDVIELRVDPRPQLGVV